MNYIMYSTVVLPGTGNQLPVNQTGNKPSHVSDLTNFNYDNVFMPIKTDREIQNGNH